MISDISLKAHPQSGVSCSRVCTTWSTAFLHPMLHIPLMWNAGQALHLCSNGDAGRLVPVRLALQVMSYIAPVCRERPYLPSM